MNAAGFVEIRRWHSHTRQLIGALSDEIRRADSRERLEATLSRFLDGPALELEGHLDVEEREVFPLVARLLQHDTGLLESLRADHETIRSLLGLLRASREECAASGLDPRAGLDTQAPSVLSDLEVLLASHFHKEDDVVNPLVSRLLLEARP